MRILIVDPNEVMRDGLRCLFEAQDDLEVVGEASDGRAALELLGERPDVALIEVVLPELNGADLARRILKARPATKVVALSRKTDDVLVREMFDAGASGYVVKSAGEDELLRALRAVAKGGTWVSPEIGHVLVRRGRGGNEDGERVFGELTPREREVLQLVAEGLTSKEIAARMGISVNTVDTHRHHVMRKLDANTVADLVKLAIRAGITTTDA